MLSGIYILPEPGVHETREVAGVDGGDHDTIVGVPAQGRGLGGEDYARV
jgi:hypothetical protein